MEECRLVVDDCPVSKYCTVMDSREVRDEGGLSVSYSCPLVMERLSRTHS